MEREYELCRHINNPVIVCAPSGIPVYKNATASVLDAYAHSALEQLASSYGAGETPQKSVPLDSLGMAYDVVPFQLEDGNIMLLLDNTAYRPKRSHILYDFQMEDILNSMSDGIFIADRNGVTLAVNKTYEEIFGIPSHEVVGRYVGDLVKDGTFSDSVILPVIQSKSSVTKLLRTRNGKEALVTGKPIFNQAGDLVMAVTNVRDISDLNALQYELQRERSLSESILKNNSQAENIVVKSPAMKRILEYAEQIAPFPTTVLITGETGAGKDVVANYIHRHSNRADKPFLKLNCSSIPENLIESELFGYNAGAFTGANKNGKPGLFELADGGTLLLDEIGDMPLYLQVKLLRVLQDGEIQRLGGSKVKKVDVRLIAATNADLESLSETGQFRKDLYYRINVVSIHVPPLRQRREEISFLAEHYLYRYCQNYGLNKIYAPEVLQCFNQYDWPGNVRELKNIVENLIVSNSGPILTLDYLPQSFLKGFKPEILQKEQQSTLRAITEITERSLISQALKETGGLRGAARVLGMNHSTLYRRIKKLGIPYGGGQGRKEALPPEELPE